LGVVLDLKKRISDGNQIIGLDKHGKPYPLNYEIFSHLARQTRQNDV
jgi:hypothetical protein